MSDIRTPLTNPGMSRDVESQLNEDTIQVEFETKRVKRYTKCFRIVATILVISFMAWIISLIVRQKYKYKVEKKEKIQNDPTRLILRTLLYDTKESIITVPTYIKYFAKNGENPMHCTGMYCWPWQTPSRVVCNIENRATPWDADVSWVCEAMCPDDYDLDTVRITCSQDPDIATNPHLGCNLVYSMSSNSYITEVDLEQLASFIVTIGLCFLILVILAMCASTYPTPYPYRYTGYNSGYNFRSSDTCDVLICAALLTTCCSNNRHSSRTWG